MHPHSLPARSYVMHSGAAPGSGQLGGEAALGVEAEAFWCFKALMDRMTNRINMLNRAVREG